MTFGATFYQYLSLRYVATKYLQYLVPGTSSEYVVA